MATITVVDYDPRWPEIFETLRRPISTAVGDLAMAIEHVGSTSVPGLAAKPAIDMDVVVDASNVGRAIERLQEIGYEHVGDLGIPQREAFRRPPGSPPHHLYLCPAGSPALANHLAFRNHLREHAAEARAYGDLKKRLAVEYAGDVPGYVGAKTAFIVAILARLGFSADAIVEIERINLKPETVNRRDGRSHPGSSPGDEPSGRT